MYGKNRLLCHEMQILRFALKSDWSMKMLFSYKKCRMLKDSKEKNVEI